MKDIACVASGVRWMRLFSLRRTLAVLFACLVAGALVVIGRSERHDQQAVALRGIAEVRKAIGPSLTRPGPADFVDNPGRTCLTWKADGRIYALELCVDGQGRVIEAVDRRGTEPKFYSIVEEPNIANMRLSAGLFASLLAKLEAEVKPR